MAEAFVNTLKRDYVSGADRSDPETLLDQVAAWIADYNTVAPHSALGYRSPPPVPSRVARAGLAG